MALMLIEGTRPLIRMCFSNRLGQKKSGFLSLLLVSREPDFLKVFNINLQLHYFLLLTSRVDLHRPKMLIIQFHTLSLWKNASHTNFIYFCKMSLIEFQSNFIVVLVSKLVSLHKKRKKNHMKKMLIIQFPYMEIV